MSTDFIADDIHLNMVHGVANEADLPPIQSNDDSQLLMQKDKLQAENEALETACEELEQEAIVLKAELKQAAAARGEKLSPTGDKPVNVEPKKTKAKAKAGKG